MVVGMGFADVLLLVTAFSNLGNPQGFPEHWEKNPLKTLDEGTATHMVAAFADGLESKSLLVDLFPWSNACAVGTDFVTRLQSRTDSS